MARYSFHTQTDTRHTDEEGLELSSPLSARKEAIRTIAAMTADCPEPFWGTRPWIVTVTNDKGLILWEISIDGFAAPAAPSN